MVVKIMGWSGARRAALLALCAALLVPDRIALHAQEPLSEARLKAAVLANLALFIDWPDASGPLRLCVAGRGGSADAAQALNGRPVKERVFEVLGVAAPNAVAGRGCHLLFITVGTGARAVEYSQAAADAPIAIVAEDAVLGLEQTHILLTLQERRPVLEVNLSAARRQGLDISSRILKLARKVL